MRIGIDVRALGTASGRRGVGAYIRGLVSGLADQLDGSGDRLVLFEGRACGDLPLARPIERVRLTRPGRAITVWDQIAWAPTLSRRGVTVFHSPFYAVPRLRPPGCRVVQTIHDLTPLKLPGTVSRRNARIFRFNFGMARTADRIIVPSDATRADVSSLMAYPTQRIAVIPQATDITAEEIEAGEATRPSTLKRLGLRGPYLLHTGGHDQVKNLPGLLEAFARLSRGRPGLVLVIAGEHGPATAGAIGRAAALGLLERVRLPGYLPRQDLIALYRSASAVVYPSYAEGFGLPVLEAMTCGAPVVATRAGSVPEVGGEACLYVDPADADAIAGAIARVLDDPALAADLAERGRTRSREFSWRETARRTLAVYRELAA